MDFVLNMMNMLEHGGTGIAIIPINCVCSLQDKEIQLRRKILNKHTLLAVLSCPTTLFYPVGTVTAIVILQAHRPHDSSVKSWFGYCRDDGFIVSRNAGRIDRNKKWEEIKTKWVNAYKNKEEIPLFSVRKAVDENSEWCAEAYLEPDYNAINVNTFKKAVDEYFVYKALYDSKIKNLEVEDESD